MALCGEVINFVRLAFAEAGVEVEFSGKGVQEKGVIIDADENRLKELGIDPANVKFGQTVVKVDERYFRPTEVDLLIGDASKAQQQLGWKPKYDLSGLVNDMVLADLQLMRKDAYLEKGGFTSLNYFE